MKASRRILEPSAFELVEEAVHALRRAPVGTLAIYYVGAVPFVLGLLFFWAYTTWFQPSGDHVAWGALGLVFLFAAMKALQTEFCARLMALRLGLPAPAWSWVGLGRTAAAQLRLQPWTLAAGLLAAVLMVPFGWVFAYAQNLVVLGRSERRHEQAKAQAMMWPEQNHVGLLMLGLLALGLWVNVGAAFLAVPWLANRLLGVENIFGFSGWWFLNSTFIASVTALTWLAIDPLVKSFYTLRVFHGQARRNGEDVRVELQLARRAAGVLRGVATGAVLLCAGPRIARTAEATPPAAVLAPAQLDRAIDEVLAGPDFRWRLRRGPTTEVRAPGGPIERFLRRGAGLIRDFARDVGRWIRDVVDWLQRHFSARGESEDRAGRGGVALSGLRLLLYGLVGVGVLLILGVVGLMVRAGVQRSGPVLAAGTVAAVPPDLRDEAVEAAQLPADGWLALAREQAQRGEWRLALRALYLATLARLAAEGLVSLARFKTNLDYEREVRRRALSRVDIATRFSSRRREYEAAWYGRAEPAEAQVRAWMAELER